jgi:hypothetical protein
MRGLMSILRTVLALALLMLIWSCDSGTSSKVDPPGGSSGDGAGGDVGGTVKKPAAPAPPKADVKKKEPQYATVQHVLIGFKGSVRGKNIIRTKEEGQALAEDILKRAKAGEDFAALVREYTDDSFPGIYKMSNHGVSAPPGGYARGGMVPAFGDVGFPLEVGGIGMASYDSTKSPFGWHIIKRTE